MSGESEEPRDRPEALGGASPMSEASRVLERVKAGDAGAGERLYELLYSELHRRARGFMRDQAAGHTLQPTALVNEAWLKLERHGSEWECRRHFLNVATRAMRSVLVDHARARLTEKRGGDRQRIEELGEPEAGGVHESPDRLLALNEALEALEKRDPEAAEIAEMRLFGGLEHAEIAKLRSVSTRTVERGWKRARTDLKSALAEDTAD